MTDIQLLKDEKHRNNNNYKRFDLEMTSSSYANHCLKILHIVIEATYSNIWMPYLWCNNGRRRSRWSWYWFRWSHDYVLALPKIEKYYLLGQSSTILITETHIKEQKTRTTSKSETSILSETIPNNSIWNWLNTFPGW